MRKIFKIIIFVVILCAVLLCAVIFVPLQRHINSDYSVTIYDYYTDEALQNMEAYVSGKYEYHLFNINSRCRFEGDIVLNFGDKEQKYYGAVIADIRAGYGSVYDCTDGEMHLLGTVTETKNPVKSGKITFTRQDKTYYAVYEKIK